MTKIVKEIKFEGVWGELESKTDFQTQLVTKSLRLSVVFTWNSAPERKSPVFKIPVSSWNGATEKFNFYFLTIFC